MTFLDWLHKLGILRYGVYGGVYHNAKERPISFMMPDVLDPERDLIHFEKRPDSKPAAEPKETHAEPQG